VDGVNQPDSAAAAKNSDISDLFLRIERGERDALFDLYDRTGGLLFGLTLKILGNPADAEETLLNIYASIWKAPVSYNANYPPLAWLVMIARSHALTRLYETRRAYTPPTQAATMEGAAEKTVTNRELEDAVARFNSLASIQREVLDWAFCSGLSAEEIAARTGMSVGAVKTHVRIGLNRLGKAPESSKINPEHVKPTEDTADENEGVAR